MLKFYDLRLRDVDGQTRRQTNMSDCV